MGRSKSIVSLLKVELRTLIKTHQHNTNPKPSVGRRPLPSLQAAVRRRRRPLCRKFVSGQFDEENPSVQISSRLLVQGDEGVSYPVMDRIGDIHRNLPRRADVIVTTVGARHKCQQGSVLNTLCMT
ncbi:CAP-Gly domain-containing linker protein 1-like [Dorcoceras hygrometricum]|uniref:CAP-Gly domain-containing linker protein 1-like n=1 Tax=Dorcoceras hygrometricum TaxID=472368 RepID=A0A2Z7B477_9LAMI|nr:CAP-Gly domain-containing linker protein 1-like [Dorcoceras hygrometricum]